MRKAYFLFSAVAAGLLAFSCTKEINQDVLPEATESTIHFRAIANGALDTKTAVLADESFIKWLVTDELKIVETLNYTVEGEEKSENNLGTAEVNSLDDNDKKAVFNATITAGLPEGATLTSATYVAAYPAKIHAGSADEQENLKQSTGENKFWRVNMPATQYPEVGSFDPDADILLSGPACKEDNSRVAEDEDLSFSFHRIGTAVKMTVKGLTNGEKLQKIVITAPVNIAGYVKVDLSNGSYLEGATPYSNQSKVLTLKYDDLTIDGNLDVWFRVLAADWEGTLEMTAETDAASYYRTTAKESAISLSSPMVFADGGLTKFSVNLGRVRVPKESGTVYTKVTSDDEIGESANYIVAYLADPNATSAVVMGPISGTNTYADAISDIAVANNAITIQNEGVQVVSLESADDEGHFYVKFGNKYLSCTASNAKLALNSDKLGTGYDIWAVSPSGIVNTKAKNSSNKPFELQYNTSSPRFANYAGTMKAITLFKNGEVHVIPAIIPSSASISVGYEGVSAAENLTFVLKNLDGEVDVTCDGTVVTEAVNVDGVVMYSVSANTGEARDGWIKIAVGEVYAEVTVNQAAAPSAAFTTVAELNALASTTGEYFGLLTNAVISFVPDAKNAVIKDATGSVLVYKDGHGYKQGQTFSGNLTVTATVYSNASEITAIDAEFVGEGATVAPQSVTLADLVGHFADWQNAYVVVEDLEVVSVSGRNINVKNGDKTYVVYSSAANATCAPGDILKVTGTIAQHSGNDQVKAWTTDAIEITQEHQKTKRTITFVQPEEGGTFTVSANGAQISSGAEVDEDTVVSLSATAAGGFSFAGWDVTGATVSGNTETATFTVGAYDVTIAAVFVSNDLTSEEISGTLTMVDNALTLTTSSGITVVQAKGTGSTAVNASYNTIATLRLYKGHTLSFSGKTIKKIEITVDGTYYGNTLQVNTGVITPTTTSGGTIVWEGNSDSITITNAATASNVQLRTKKVVVYY